MLVSRLRAGARGGLGNASRLRRAPPLRPVLASLRAFSDTTGGRGPPTGWDFSRWGDYGHPVEKGDWAMGRGQYYQTAEIESTNTGFQGRKPGWREYLDPRMPREKVPHRRMLALPLPFVIFGFVVYVYQLLYPGISWLVGFSPIDDMIHLFRAEFMDLQFHDYDMEHAEADHRVTRYRVVDHHDERNIQQMARHW